MEQHPVPRNISGFQFHLIGDMTLRQFGYLAAGVLTGYFVYKAAPFSAIVNIPLALSSGFAGFAFAFLPIQERPLDKWILAFIKSIMSPTQYIWYKRNPPPDILARTYALHPQVVQPTQQAAHKETDEKLRAYLATVPIPIHESLNAAEKRYIDKTLSLFQTSSLATPPLASAVQPTSTTSASLPLKTSIPEAAQIEPIQKIAPQEKEETEQIKEAKQVQPIPTTVDSKTEEDKEQAKENHTVLKTQLFRLAAEKQALEQELQKLQQQLKGAATPVIKPSVVPDKKDPVIKVVSPSAVSDIGMINFQQAANLITGVIKDPQKKLLPNIILTIKDKSGLPVRALKTNKLGQFSTATPLSNGIYFLEVEDPMKRYVFDVAQITLSGKVFLPFEIIAKGEKELIREKLTKELFGNQLV